MNKLKVVTIGGGSSYSPELIEGFIKRNDTLPIDELWLVDIEEGKGKLEIIGNLARRMIKKANADIKVFTTLDRREALKDADFVTTQFRVGQLDAREHDELIPLKYRVIGQETNGPGGMFKALRTIPVIMDIIEDCKELCPDAWIISFTNPAGLNAEAVFRYSGWKKFIGLCNSPIVIKHRIAKLLNLDVEELRIDFAGLNHMVFGLHVYYKGDEITKEVISKLGEYNENLSFSERFETIPYTKEFLNTLNCIPSPYLRYYFVKQQMYEHAFEEASKGGSRAQVVKEVEKNLFEKYADVNLDVKPKEIELRGGAHYSDAACNLINSIYNNLCDIQIVNTLNNGACSSFRDDEVVEISCVITKDGPKPITMGRLPIMVEGLCRQIKSYEIMSAEGAMNGNYSTILSALTINPLVQDETVAAAIIDEMLEVNKNYLSKFSS
ncbi:6-phospho-beta-glucosidase [Breznakia pachnodae]|uniref:6-phospho-beta-glucosidase n=1 Tax=Breznakia pachnodae TaxID=265178 RepID=A0ABU0E518_9FIRM|nr:6-phospho-beta-glucosidase [Breznakia pachnodae]MDQ0361804.1 6-phospho-beta-glucosidase [Breznakia pachnodae]